MEALDWATCAVEGDVRRPAPRPSVSSKLGAGLVTSPSTNASSGQEISQTALLTAWLQRDMPGTLQWLESLPEPHRSRMSGILDELLHPTVPTKS